MDDRLAKAFDFAQYRQTIEQNRKTLRLRVETLKKVTCNSGTFTATPALISFVYTLITTGDETAIIEDDNANPIEIGDMNEFLEDLKSAYHAAMNQYQVGISKLNKARNIKSIMDW